VVAWLVDELVELGHAVTLFASGDSRTRGRLHPVWPNALRLGQQRSDQMAATALSLEAISKRKHLGAGLPPSLMRHASPLFAAAAARRMPLPALPVK
jgi:hypothetical protein